MIYVEAGSNPARELSSYRAFHWVTGLSLFATSVLIALGGFVHNTGSSLACPDWPLCFGQVMPKMEGAVAIEHSHRLLGAAVGFFAVLGAFFSWNFRALRPDLFRASLWALGLVIFQGVLGGATVLLGLSPLLSTAHLGTSQVFLGLLLWIFLRSRSQTGVIPAIDGRLVRPLAIAAAALYLQMLLGASIRHGGAGSICGLGWDSSLLCIDQGTASESAVLWPASLPARFHMLHRFGAIAASGVILWALLKVWRREGGRPLRALAGLALGLLLAQVTVGVFTVATYIGVTSTTLHLVLAAALWATLLAMNFRARESQTA